MPLDPVAQAGWYRLFGFGLIQMRMLSAVWGLVALLAWSAIVWVVSGDCLAGGLTAFLISVDFTFLWSSGDGRMDMMCVALGTASIASYLALRKDHVHRGILVANCCAAASIFTHPNGLIWIALLALLVLRDRRKLRLRDLAALLPYAVFAAVWGLYIAQRPDLFAAQFTANSHPPVGGARGAGIFHPKSAAIRELGRYVNHFGFAPVWAAPMPRFSIAIPILCWLGCLLAVYYAIRYKIPGLRLVLSLLGGCVLLMTLLESLKAHNYLPAVMPIYAAVLAVLTSHLLSTRSAARIITLILCLLLVAVQVRTLSWKLDRHELQSGYVPLIGYLKSRSGLITGTSTLAFGLGYGRFTDDARLGMYSGKMTPLVVVDRFYRWDWNVAWPESDTASEAFVRAKLKNYNEVWHRGDYQVYELPPHSH